MAKEGAGFHLYTCWVLSLPLSHVFLSLSTLHITVRGSVYEMRFSCITPCSELSMDPQLLPNSLLNITYVRHGAKRISLMSLKNRKCTESQKVAHSCRLGGDSARI